MAAAIAVTLIAAKSNTLSIPYHWDEGVYALPALDLAERGWRHVLPGQHASGEFHGHPPALFLCLAAAQTVFGEARAVHRSVILAFAFVAVFATYRLGSLLYDRRTGALACALLCTTPLFFAQSGLVLAEVPLAALAVASVDQLQRGNHRWAALLACGLALLKETSGALLALLALRAWSLQRSADRSRALYLAPVALLTAYLGAEALATGSLVSNPYFHAHPFLHLDFASPFAVLQRVFVDQGRWCVTAFLLVCALRGTQREFGSALPLFAAIIGIYVAVFASIYFLSRYALIVFPFFFLLGARAVTLVVGRDRRLLLPTSAALIAAALWHLHGNDTGSGSFEKDMQYLDVVETHRRAASFAENAGAAARILAAWPLDQALANPVLGYVSRPLRVVAPNEPFDLLIHTEQGAAENERLRELADRLALPLLAEFERGNKRVRVYGAPAPPPA